MSLPNITGVSSDVCQRIFDAANNLFEQNGRESMPTVDAVRRAAGVDMNSASLVMKEWRKLKIAQPAPVEIRVPENVQQVGQSFITAVWKQAQEQANESLNAAQQAWDKEREELENMRKELATAFELQEGELKFANEEIAKRDETIRNHLIAHSETQGKLTQAQVEFDKSEERNRELQSRIEQYLLEISQGKQTIEKLHAEHLDAQTKHHEQLDSIKAELNIAQQNTLTANAKLAAQAESHMEQQNRSQRELENIQARLDKLEQENQRLMQQHLNSIEQAANLKGKLEAVQEQNISLLASIERMKDKPE